MNCRNVEGGMTLRDFWLRLAGVGALLLGGLALRWLFGDLAALAPVALDYAAAAIGFLCSSAGAVLFVLGAHVFTSVAVAERWARR